MDWIYRDLDRVHRVWADCRAGRYTVEVQAGHPLGFYSPAYAGEVALGRVLGDPTGELTALRAETVHYPPALGAALVAGGWETGLLLDGAAKGAAGGDAGYVAGCLFRVVGVLAQALHGRAGRWLVNEKGMLASAGRLPGTPPDLTARAQALLGALGRTPVEAGGDGRCRPGARRRRAGLRRPVRRARPGGSRSGSSRCSGGGGHRVGLVSEMTYRRLGDSGLVVSVVGIGCNNFGRKLDSDGTRAVVDAALDAGITFFDTADIYGEPQGGSEELLGQALKGRRDDVVVATKFGMDMHGANGPDHGARGARRYIARAVEASLRRLGTDHIDLYQMHEPDPGTPIDETLAALDDLVTAGKLRYLGNSNFAGWQIADADWTASSAGRTRFISAQNHYSLLERGVEDEVIPACERFGLGMLPFFPLANGLLTGKYKRGEAPPTGSRLAGGGRYAERLAAARWDTIEAIEAYAAERGISMLQVAIGGLAARPAVTSVIAGATTPDQVRANAAAGTWQPTDEDLDALDALL